MKINNSDDYEDINIKVGYNALLKDRVDEYSFNNIGCDESWE